MKMDLKTIEQFKIFETVAGSHSYGLNNEQSDVDFRGIFVLPNEYHLSLEAPPKQVGDVKHDITFYELKRFFELASGCNPNIMELLYMPDDCIMVMTPMMEKLIANRDMFLSQRAFYTFSGYAHQQIKKAKGRNKWVNNPQPEERPDPMNYLYWIEEDNLPYKRINTEIEYFSCRPKKIDCTENIIVSRCEHGFGFYRAYGTGGSGENFFKGKQITCTSITKEQERRCFLGIVSFNETQYKSDVSNWKNYWEWMKNRNDARWELQESGKMDYDCYVESETEFLTNNGWKKFDEILETELLGEINKNGNLQYSLPIDKLDKLYTGNILEFDKANSSYAITSNHNLYISHCKRSKKNKFSTKYNEDNAQWYFESAQNLKNGRKSYFHQRIACENINGDFDISLNKLLLTGMFLSDGSVLFGVSGNVSGITISQNENGRLNKWLEKINIPYTQSFKILESLKKSYTYFFSDSIKNEIYEECGHGSVNKRLPKWVSKLSNTQFNIFLDCLIDGDGTFKKDGQRVMYSTSIKLLGDLQKECINHGIHCNVYNYEDKPYKGTFKDDSTPCSQLYIPAKQHQSKIKTFTTKHLIERYVINERVVCFTMPTGTLITRRNGKVAMHGNCKNMMHCFRLILSTESILSKGCPIVRFEGKDRDFLMDIRKGKFEYDSLMEKLETKLANLDVLKAKSKLQQSVNMKDIHNLYMEMINE